MTQHFFGAQISYQFATMHTVSYEFLMKPKESAGCHQTLSSRVGAGHETTINLHPVCLLQTSLADVLGAMGAIPSGFRDSTLSKLLHDSCMSCGPIHEHSEVVGSVHSSMHTQGV